MRKIRTISEDEMIAAFLSAELHLPRYMSQEIHRKDMTLWRLCLVENAVPIANGKDAPNVTAHTEFVICYHTIW